MVKVSISLCQNCITEMESYISRILKCSERNPLHFSKTFRLFEFDFSLVLTVTRHADADEHPVCIFPEGDV